MCRLIHLDVGDFDLVLFLQQLRPQIVEPQALRMLEISGNLLTVNFTSIFLDLAKRCSLYSFYFCFFVKIDAAPKLKIS